MDEPGHMCFHKMTKGVIACLAEFHSKFGKNVEDGKNFIRNMSIVKSSRISVKFSKIQPHSSHKEIGHNLMEQI